jgi:hypothetical protein
MEHAEIYAELNRIQLEMDIIQFERNLRDLIRYRERRYARDQPRVPAGDSDGGRWTSIGIAAALRVRKALDRGVTRVADIASELEELGGGRPTLRPSPKGAPQFFFPNGMTLRFDLMPGQYLTFQRPHINLEVGGKNYHLDMR